jgi:hypothetical protein
MKDNKTLFIILGVIGGILILCLCSCVAIVALTNYYRYRIAFPELELTEPEPIQAPTTTPTPEGLSQEESTESSSEEYIELESGILIFEEQNDSANELLDSYATSIVVFDETYTLDDGKLTINTCRTYEECSTNLTESQYINYYETGDKIRKVSVDNVRFLRSFRFIEQVEYNLHYGGITYKTVITPQEIEDFTGLSLDEISEEWVSFIDSYKYNDQNLTKFYNRFTQEIQP